MNFKQEVKKDFYLTLGSNTFASSERSLTYAEVYMGLYDGFGRHYDWNRKLYEQYVYNKDFSGKLSIVWKSAVNSDGRKEKFRYFYVALAKDDFITLPKGEYDSYHFYGFMGRLILPEKPLGKSLFDNVETFIDSSTLELKHATGKHENFYYYITGKKKNDTLPPWYKQENWIEVEGVEITKEQFSDITCIDILSKDCKPFLSESTPNLTKTQRDYIKRHPVSKDDFSELIEYYKNLPNNPWK